MKINFVANSNPMKRATLVIALVLFHMLAMAQYAHQYRLAKEKPDFPNQEHVDFLVRTSYITGLSGIAAVGAGTYFFVYAACNVPTGDSFNPFKGRALLGMAFLIAGIGAISGSYALYAKAHREEMMLYLQNDDPYSPMLSLGVTQNGFGLAFHF